MKVVIKKTNLQKIKINNNKKQQKKNNQQLKLKIKIKTQMHHLLVLQTKKAEKKKQWPWQLILRINLLIKEKCLKWISMNIWDGKPDVSVQFRTKLLNIFLLWWFGIQWLFRWLQLEHPLILLSRAACSLWWCV